MDRLAATHVEAGAPVPAFYCPQRVSGPALQTLLPGYRFVIVAWDYSPASGLYNVLASDPQGHTDVLGGYGNYEGFGTLLSRARVPIRSPHDAELVWHAFNEAHVKRWDQNGIACEYRQPGAWCVYFEVRDGVRHFYELDVDVNQIVTSGQFGSYKLSSGLPP
jgi:hypothetical protein